MAALPFIISDEVRNLIVNKQNEEAKLILPTENLDAYIDNFGLPLLHLAVSNANAEMTKYFIDNGCNIDAVYDDQFTPLVVAIIVGCVETIQILIDAHCKQNIKGDYLRNIIEFCTSDSPENPSNEGRQLAFEMCLKRIKEHFGANEEDMFEALFLADCQLYTIVRSMKDAKATKYFLDNACDVDQREPATNLTPLQIAIEVLHFDNVKILLQYGASTHVMSEDYKKNIVHFLKNLDNKAQDRLAIFELLIQYNVNFQDQFFDTFKNVDDLYTRGRAVSKIFLAQLVLDDACGIEISDQIGTWARNQLETSQIMRNFKSLCEQQVMLMKEIIFYEYISLFDVLVSSRENLMNYAKNEHFITNFENAINNTIDVDSYYYRALRNRVPGTSTETKSKLDSLSEKLLDFDMKNV